MAGGPLCPGPRLALQARHVACAWQGPGGGVSSGPDAQGMPTPATCPGGQGPGFQVLFPKRSTREPPPPPQAARHLQSLGGVPAIGAVSPQECPPHFLNPRPTHRLHHREQRT